MTNFTLIHISNYFIVYLIFHPYRCRYFVRVSWYAAIACSGTAQSENNFPRCFPVNWSPCALSTMHFDNFDLKRRDIYLWTRPCAIIALCSLYRLTNSVGKRWLRNLLYRGTGATHWTTSVGILSLTAA